MRLPVRVPDLNDKDKVLTLITEQEVTDYQQQMYARTTKITNLRGEPQPNFSVSPTPEEYKKLTNTHRLF
jgi:hypothetical protein